MRLIYRLPVLALLSIWPAAGFAITLINRDTADQKLVVIEGDKESETIIKAGEKLELCQKSCVIRLPEGEKYIFDGGEIVSLEEGLLYLDNLENQDKTTR